MKRDGYAGIDRRPMVAVKVNGVAVQDRADDNQVFTKPRYTVGRRCAERSTPNQTSFTPA